MVKTKALDIPALETRLPGKNLLQTASGGERSLTPGPRWLKTLKPQQEIAFLGVTGESDHAYGVVLEIDLDNERLSYLPLPKGTSPLSILSKPDRHTALEDLIKSWPETKARFDDLIVRDIQLSETGERLTSPISQPNQVFAVAANYPSHLFVDLSLPVKPALIERLRQSRPRIFRKYPPVPAPGVSTSLEQGAAELPGLFGSIAAPAQVHIPTLEGSNQTVPGHMDYEVEVAVLIGRNLTWDEAHAMSDAELYEVVAGYLLFSDAKVRDPQAMGRIMQVFHREKTRPDNPYRTGDAALDGTLGMWDETTCHWWSYAASWGHYATFGPFLIAASGRDAFPPRTILSGRSYSSSVERGVSPPKGVPKDQLLLRQAAMTTLEKGYSDALIWDLPTIIRSLLDPTENALNFTGESPVLHAGDLIALGTPGGTVISAKPWWLLSMVKKLLFWKSPDDFYKMFFSPANGDYLHPGDELFLWGEGLGYQLLKVGKPRSEVFR